MASYTVVLRERRSSSGGSGEELHMLEEEIQQLSQSGVGGRWSEGEEVSRRGKRRKVTSNLIYLAGLIVILALAFARVSHYKEGSKYRETELMSTGNWKSREDDSEWHPHWPGDSILSPEKYRWKPEGCEMHEYTRPEILDCFKGRRVVVMGDSTARVLFYGLMHKIDDNLTVTAGGKHDSRILEYGSVKFEFYWDAYMHLESFEEALRAEEGEHALPALLIFQFGIWYQDTRWGRTMDQFKARIEKIASAAANRKLGDTVILPQVEITVAHFNKDSDAQPAALIPEMNEFMEQTVQQYSTSNSSMHYLTAFNQLIQGLDDEVPDGVHFSTKVAEAQADIVLNLACSSMLPPVRPFDQVCGRTYPDAKSSGMFMLILLCLVSLLLFLGLFTEISLQHEFLTFEFCSAFACSTAPLAFSYFVNRPLLFTKLVDGVDSMESSILLGAISSGGISGMILHEFSNRVEKEERQSDFMSRDQTRESKGLLIVIAIFYWINASSTSFPPFLLSAFFFLFTYSHTTYFINEKDYSYQRVGMIVARVNVLSILFAFMTSRSSMDYFFAPLATFVFIFIWTTLRIGSNYNSSPLFLVGKFCISSLIVHVCTYSSIISIATASLCTLIDSVLSTELSSFDFNHLNYQNAFAPIAGIILSLLIHLTSLPIKSTSVLLTCTTLLYLVSHFLTLDSTLSTAPLLHLSFILTYILCRNSTASLRETTLPLLVTLGDASLEISLVSFYLFSSGLEAGSVNFLPFLPFYPALILTAIMPLLIGQRLASARRGLLLRREKNGEVRDGVEMNEC